MVRTASYLTYGFTLQVASPYVQDGFVLVVRLHPTGGFALCPGRVLVVGLV